MTLNMFDNMGNLKGGICSSHSSVQSTCHLAEFQSGDKRLLLAPLDLFFPEYFCFKQIDKFCVKKVSKTQHDKKQMNGKQQWWGNAPAFRSRMECICI